MATHIIKTYSLQFIEVSLLSNHHVKVKNNKGVYLHYSWETWQEITEAISIMQQGPPVPPSPEPSPKSPLLMNRIKETSSNTELRVVICQFKGYLNAYVREYLLNEAGSIPTRKGFRLSARRTSFMMCWRT